jgi:hypothetical protein
MVIHTRNLISSDGKQNKLVKTQESTLLKLSEPKGKKSFLQVELLNPTISVSRVLHNFMEIRRSILLQQQLIINAYSILAVDSKMKVLKLPIFLLEKSPDWLTLKI